MIKVLILFSGGLDSVLSVKILQKQKNLSLTGLLFKSYFFNNEKRIKKIAQEIDLPLRIVDISKEHLEMVKSPLYGYGQGINPCLDCKILMFKKAKQLMTKMGKQTFIVSGEVLGQRPMSQNRQALNLTEKKSGLQRFLLRPLSALLLEETTPENKGWIDKKKLLSISGRSRKKQIILAKKFGIKDFLTPAGGCLLTDKEFAEKLKDLFKLCPNCRGNDIELLKIGRHFWENKVKIVVGRNHEENIELRNLAREGDYLIEMEKYSGPLTLIRNYGLKKEFLVNKERIFRKAKKLTQYYSPKVREIKTVKFILSRI